MDRQEHINHKMRRILVDWLVLVQMKFNLLQETLLLTVSIIDRFLEVRKHTGYAYTTKLALTPGVSSTKAPVAADRGDGNAHSLKI